MTYLKLAALTGTLLIQLLRVNAQSATASVHDVVSPEGQVTVPISVAGFNDLGAITLFIDYDEEVLAFVDIQNSSLDGVSVNAVDGVLGVSWFNNTGAEGYDINGTLFEMVFQYQQGYGSITFMEEDCEVTDFELNEIPVQYYYGEVSYPMPAEAAVEDQTYQEPGTVVHAPLFCDFGNIGLPVGSFELHLDYNGEKLQYQGADELAFPDITIESIEEEDRLVISRSSEAGMTYSGQLLQLAFLFQGGYTSLSFDTVASVVRTLDSQMLPAVFENGLINEGLFTHIDDDSNGNASAGDGLKLQLSPNPVYSQAKLSYSLPTDGTVTVKLFNTIGSQITTLFNRFQHHGNHTISFRPYKYGLKPGIYFIILEVNSENIYYRSKMKFIYGHTGSGAFGALWNPDFNGRCPFINRYEVCSALFTTKKA